MTAKDEVVVWSAADRETAPGVHWWALATVLLACLAWALLSPLASPADEPEHLIYSAAVVRGQSGSTTQGEVTVPREVITAGQRSCVAFRPTEDASCQGPLTADASLAAYSSRAASYPPLYYAIVGLPTLLGLNEVTWYAARVLSVLLAGLLLLPAFLALRGVRSGWLLAGTVVAVTPMFAFLVGAVNPNGAEIAAGLGVALGAGSLILRRRSPSGSAMGPLLAIAIPLGYLCLARPRSYLESIGLLAVVLILLPRSAWHAIRATGPRAFVAAAIPLASLIAAVTWERATRMGGGAAAGGLTPVQQVKLAVSQLYNWWSETIGLFGWRDHHPPGFVVYSWLALTLAFLGIGLAAGVAREKLGLLALAAGGLVLAPLAVLITTFPDGLGYQGRYAMPLTVTFAVFAAAIAARHVVPGLVGRRLASWLPALCAFGMLISLGGSMIRYGAGLPAPLNPAALAATWDWWLPKEAALMAAAVLLCYAACSLILGLLLRRESSWQRREHLPEPVAQVPA